jgi:hypothetical protein
MRGLFNLPSGSGKRDPGHRAYFSGLILPAILVAWALLNALTCQAAWPVMRGRSLTFVWVNDWLKVFMAACVKLGIAAACFGWYFMANRDDWSYWCPLVTFIGCGIAVLAFVIGSLSFVW